MDNTMSLILLFGWPIWLVLICVVMGFLPKNKSRSVDQDADKKEDVL